MAVVPASVQATALSSLLEDARTLFDQNSDDQVLHRLLPRLTEGAGTPEYDLMLARAYLKNGQPERSLFALERVLMVAPHHLRATLLKAEAHQAIGEGQWARESLEALPGQVLKGASTGDRKRYDALLDRLGETARRTLLYGQLALTLTHDDNITAGPDDKTLWIPGISTTEATELDDSAEDTGPQTTLTARLGVRHLLDGRQAINGGLTLGQMENHHRRDLDQQYATLYLGYSRRLSRDLLSATVHQQYYLLGEELYRKYWGLSGQWQYKLESGAWRNLWLRRTSYTFPDNREDDAVRHLLGGDYLKGYDDKSTPLAYRVGFYGGREQAQQDGMAYVGYQLAGLQFGGRYKPMEPLNLSASIGVEHRHHDEPDDLFYITRRDTEWSASATLRYRFREGWHIGPSISMVRNRSNMELYEYDRIKVAVTLSWSHLHELLH